VFDDHRIAILVPCYDVSSRLAAVVRTIPAWVDHIVLVDDGSRDAFGAVVEQVRAADPSL
jgi:glycosyltransferase involved in cell wall biosynthesis